MNRADLRANAKERFGDPNQDVYSDTYWNNRLAEAYRRVQGSNPYWPWLESSNGEIIVAAGSNAGNLPNNFRRLISVWNATDQIPMAEITGAREYRRLYPQGIVSPGSPIHYRLSANTMQVFPTPTTDTEIDVDYAAIPGAFTTDGDSPEWPLDYHDMLTEYALAYAYLDDGNVDQYNAHMSVFTAQLAEMTRATLTARGDGYPQIDDNWFE